MMPQAPGASYAQPGHAAPPAKKSGTALAVVLILVGVVVLAAAGLGVYLFFLRGKKHDSIAHTHLPASCKAVAVVDVRALLEVPSVKEHVVPAIDEKARRDENAGKLAHFLLTAQLNPKKDLKEIAICVEELALRPKFVAIVGGRLLERGFVDALEQHGKEEKFHPPKDVDGLRVIEAKERDAYVTQAADAAILLGNDLDLVKKAAARSDAFEAYALPLDQTMVGVIPAATMAEIAGRITPMLALIGGGALPPFGRAEVTLTLEPGKLGGRMELATDAAAAEVAQKLNQIVAAVSLLPPMMNPTGIPIDILRQAVIQAQGKAVVLTLPIPQETIESVMKEIAARIRRADDEV
jgi:hypothetical protein